ncbi:hypothetical protein [Bradyrhizobium diazoefficiens]
MFSIMTLLFVVAIILWCFSTQARAQAQLETATTNRQTSHRQDNHAA